MLYPVAAFTYKGEVKVNRIKLELDEILQHDVSFLCDAVLNIKGDKAIFACSGTLTAVERKEGTRRF